VTMGPTLDRRRIVGLAVGSLWLVVAGALFGTWSLLSIETDTAAWLLVGVGAAVLVLIVRGVAVIRTARRLPIGRSPRTPAQRAIGRRFAWIVGAEIAAFATVNPILASMGHVVVLPAVNLGIVGIHFLPLARLFDVPRYYALGLIFCAIPAVTLLWVPADRLIGSALAWFVVPPFACAIVAIAFGAVGLREARVLASGFGASPVVPS
jgi:hypothetical protein